MSDLTIVTLTCGDWFRLHHPAWSVGDWTSCALHSAIVGYDPDNGDPVFDRDQQVVSVQTEQEWRAEKSWRHHDA